MIKMFYLKNEIMSIKSKNCIVFGGLYAIFCPYFMIDDKGLMNKGSRFKIIICKYLKFATGKWK